MDKPKEYPSSKYLEIFKVNFKDALNDLSQLNDYIFGDVRYFTKDDGKLCIFVDVPEYPMYQIVYNADYLIQPKSESEDLKQISDVIRKVIEEYEKITGVSRKYKLIPV